MRQIRLEAEPRTSSGSGAARALRRDGKVPAVIYGFGEPATAVQLNLRDVQAMLKEHSEHALVNLIVAGASENVVVRELQRESVRRRLLHVDFQRVHLDEEISVDVEVILDGTPVGVREGGVLEFFARTLHVRALPAALPDALRIDVSALGIGDAIHVRDLPLPDGVTVETDPDTVVVTVASLRAGTEEAAEPSAEEPELVSKRPAAEA
jgi:large subunit ribosomal protein L25